MTSTVPLKELPSRTLINPFASVLGDSVVVVDDAEKHKRMDYDLLDRPG